MCDPREPLHVAIKISFPGILLMLMHLRCSGIKSFFKQGLHECQVRGDGAFHRGVNVMLGLTKHCTIKYSVVCIRQICLCFKPP